MNLYSEPECGNIDPLKLLASEIIIQAIKDYKDLKKCKQAESGAVCIDELEYFFSSDWCDDLLTLCQVNITGEKILEFIDKELQEK